MARNKQLHLRVTEEELKMFALAAGDYGQLSEWVRATLSDAVEKSKKS